jgi:hypothetical protein
MPSDSETASELGREGFEEADNVRSSVYTCRDTSVACCGDSCMYALRRRDGHNNSTRAPDLKTPPAAKKRATGVSQQHSPSANAATPP